MSDLIQVRRDTAANWTAVNPVLADGEFGYATDTEILKIGDGAATWTALPTLAPASGGLLTATSHNPATLTSYATSSTALVDADATNLTVTFTAPASGQVLVRLSVLGSVSATGGGAQMLWALRTPAGATVSGTEAQVVSDHTQNTYRSLPVVVSGLTPGASYTYRWGYRSANAAVQARMYAGTGAGPAVMEVWAA